MKKKMKKEKENWRAIKQKIKSKNNQIMETEELEKDLNDLKLTIQKKKKDKQLG